MSSTLLESQNMSYEDELVFDPKSKVFIGPHALTKTPRQISTEYQENMGSLTTPTKGRDGFGEPWTPTSNLKMLISAASPEIRNRDKLCVDNPEETTEVAKDGELGEEAEKQISRKEKSLGLLCHKFLARYPDNPNPALNNDICLDDVATELSVERRRIYDIMNVLESLHMVSRLAKNRYTWRGRVNLPHTLARLRQVGEKHRYGPQMQQIRQRCHDKELDLEGEEKENEEVVDMEEGEQGSTEMFFVELPGVEFRAASVNSRKDKSLRVMSQKFVMLFLVSQPRLVSLEVAGRILIGEDQVADRNKNKFKTKVRRLYDIANVLQSLKLIEKVHVTDERGRKTAYKWIGPEHFPRVEDVENITSSNTSTTRQILESCAAVDNCTKNLFSSPGGKRTFTRHPSLIKLAKSIQADRRKINSAPTSPVRDHQDGSSGSRFFPSKMAQLAAICKMQLDQQSTEGQDTSKPPVSKVTEPPSAPQTPAAPQTSVSIPAESPSVLLPPGVQYPSQAVGPLSYQCSPLIPVLLPQSGGPASYALYLQPSSLRPRPLARPQPTSLAVRSMTFEDRLGCSPGAAPPSQRSPSASPQPSRGQDPSSPAALKRACADVTARSSCKVRRVDSSCRDASPKLCEILQTRLRSRRGDLLPTRPSPRALHLDPEFLNTPGSAGANQVLAQSVETFLEKEEKVITSDSEAALTPVRAVPLTTRNIHTETLVPTGYLIPLSQQAFLSSTESNRIPTPPYSIYHTPTAGSQPPPMQEFTPTGRTPSGAPPASPFQPQSHQTPSPAILNFTLQNLGLIPGPPQPLTPERGPSLPSPRPPHLGPSLPSPLSSHLNLPQRGMVFVRPMSPLPVQHAMPGQPLTFISLQQPLLTTPKGRSLPKHSFFQTPVSLSPLATVVTSGKSVYVPQRRLEVEDS